jgi:hypothetical protein
MDKSIKQLNRQFENGELPLGFDYSKPIQCGFVDIEKLKYNAFYKTFNYYESKFPKDFIGIFGLEPMIKEIVEYKQDIDLIDELEIKKNTNPEKPMELVINPKKPDENIIIV